MTLLKIAFRNVFKNRRRSLITILAIAFGFTAVAMFRGYAHNAYEKISLGAIFLEAPGHLVIFKKGFLSEGKIDPETYLLDKDELELARNNALQHPEVVWAAPKLALVGLITNGEVSTVFLADAIHPEDEEDLWGFWDYHHPPSSNLLPEENPIGSLMGTQLAQILDLDVGGTAVLMATTRYGQMNAVDIELSNTTPTFSDATDDKYVKMPLGLARDLYDFEGADRLCVLLADKSKAPIVRNELVATLANAGLAVEIRTWDELSIFYSKVRDYLDVVFLFIFVIVMIIVVMSTFNTMSMAVFERTREIGTLRAIGLKPAHAVTLFATEGALIGLAGSIAGLVLTCLAFVSLRWAKLSYKPPGIADPVTIEIDLVPQVLALTFLFFIGLAVFSAALPARRGAKQNIVDALGHV